MYWKPANGEYKHNRNDHAHNSLILLYDSGPPLGSHWQFASPADSKRDDSVKKHHKYQGKNVENDDFCNFFNFHEMTVFFIVLTPSSNTMIFTVCTLFDPHPVQIRRTEEASQEPC